MGEITVKARELVQYKFMIMVRVKPPCGAEFRWHPMSNELFFTKVCAVARAIELSRGKEETEYKVMRLQDVK